MEFIYLHSDRGWWAHRPLPRHNGAPSSPAQGAYGYHAPLSDTPWYPEAPGPEAGGTTSFVI